MVSFFGDHYRVKKNGWVSGTLSNPLNKLKTNIRNERRWPWKILNPCYTPAASMEAQILGIVLVTLKDKPGERVRAFLLGGRVCEDKSDWQEGS